MAPQSAGLRAAPEDVNPAGDGNGGQAKDRNDAADGHPIEIVIELLAVDLGDPLDVAVEWLHLRSRKHKKIKAIKKCQHRLVEGLFFACQLAPDPAPRVHSRPQYSAPAYPL